MDLIDKLFLPEKLDKTFHKKCVEFIQWVDSEIDETAIESGLSCDFSINARKGIDNLKAISDYLREVEQRETTNETDK